MKQLALADRYRQDNYPGGERKIKMDLESGTLPEAGTQFTVTVEYIVDEKAKLKKGIVLGIGLLTTALILANFILSYIFLGNITFWV